MSKCTHFGSFDSLFWLFGVCVCVCVSQSTNFYFSWNHATKMPFHTSSNNNNKQKNQYEHFRQWKLCASYFDEEGRGGGVIFANKHYLPYSRSWYLSFDFCHCSITVVIKSMLNVCCFLTLKHCVESSSVTISKLVNLYICANAYCCVYYCWSNHVFKWRVWLNVHNLSAV